MDLHYLKDNALTLGLAVGGVLAVGVGLFKFRQWVAGGVCRSKAALTGKTAIITGANTGIGLETAVDLARRGARVILACRSVERGEKAAVLVRQRSGSQDVAFVQLDLSSQDSIRAAAKSILEGETRVDILVNNAGIALGAYKTTIDGHEAHFGVNHLGHFLFTNLLLPRLVKIGSSMARVVTVTASLYKKCSRFDFEAISSSDPARYSSQMPGRAYSQSKLANILFSRWLSRRLEGAGVSTYAVHPGIVYSELSRDFIKVYPLYKRMFLMVVGSLFLKTPYQGAQTTIYCAVAEELEGVSGRYYGDCREEKLATAAANDDEVAEELWRVSAKMVGLEM